MFKNNSQLRSGHEMNKDNGINRHIYQHQHQQERNIFPVKENIQ